MKVKIILGAIAQPIWCSEPLRKEKSNCLWDLDFILKFTLTLDVKDVDTQSTNSKTHLLSKLYTSAKFKQNHRN